jgi:hypothetical protein
MSDGNATRRRVLKLTVAGLTVSILLPSRWIKPVVELVIVPAHAAASPAKAPLIPFPYQIDFAMYGNDVMDLTSAGLRSM